MSHIGLRLTASPSRAVVAAAARASAAAWSRTSGRRASSRFIHHRKELPYPVENGLGDFLSPEALNMVAVEYQNGLLDRLNDQVRGACLAWFVERDVVIWTESGFGVSDDLCFYYHDYRYRNGFGG